MIEWAEVKAICEARSYKGEKLSLGDLRLMELASVIPGSHVPSFGSERERAAWVKYRMDLAGFNQRDIARSAGVSGAYVNQVLRGHRCGREIKKLIADRLGLGYMELWVESMKEVA